MFMTRMFLVLLPLVLTACSSPDRGSFGTFKRSLNNTSYGYVVMDDPTNQAPTELIEVFDVRPGDCGSNGGWSDCDKDRERSELSEAKKKNQRGKEYWYGWSIYFPEDYVNVYPTKVALGQFHQHKSHPVWMFQNSSGGYHLDRQVRGYTEKYDELISEEDLRGKWHKIEIHAKWQVDDSGFFKVWVNGEQKVDYKGKTMSAHKVYFKYGVYRSYMSRYKLKHGTDSVPAQKVYFSNVKRGSSREALAP
ncbi:polysaccharide lyase [Parasalinivibrio latis]|uniref:polysaccharide lyase n=1 Tax=Parasalinivibrio latis TaxID=2952610 RepID=UPI0030E57104